VAVNSIYASIIPSYKYNLVLKSFSYGTQVMGHPVHNEKIDLRKCNFSSKTESAILRSFLFCFGLNSE
jgi:hypothetical protein